MVSNLMVVRVGLPASALCLSIGTFLYQYVCAIKAVKQTREHEGLVEDRTVCLAAPSASVLVLLYQ